MVKLEPGSPFKDDTGFRLFSKRRRQPRWLRVSLAAALATCVYLVVINIGTAPALSPGLLSGLGTTTPRSPNANELGLNAHGLATADQLPLAGAKGTFASPGSVDDSARSAGVGRGFEKSKARTPGVDDDDDDDDATRKLESDLRHVFAIMPDELHVRELLRPIESSGKERLREIGLRARAFRTLLEAWEEIHFVHRPGSVTVRDDIVTYLSRAKDLSAVSASRTRADIIRSYENFRYFLTKLSALLFPWTAPYFADHMTLHASVRHGGRGIVLSGGDGQLHYLLTSVKAIRKLGCHLPIEVMYLGDEDLGDDSRSELEALPGVVTRDMEQMVRDEGWQLKGWAGKPFAILLSSFREVIFIDADAQFFKSPEVLFDDEAYEETGALFFRDRLMFPESKRKWLQQILPKPMSRKVRQSRFWTGESGHMQESGVIVVDKWRHFMALLMVTRMNGPDRDGDKEKGVVGTYDMVYGDKETFWLGWELVGDTDYAFHPGEAGNMGVAHDNIQEAMKSALGPAEGEKDTSVAAAAAAAAAVAAAAAAPPESDDPTQPEVEEKASPETAAGRETGPAGNVDGAAGGTGGQGTPPDVPTPDASTVDASPEDAVNPAEPVAPSRRRAKRAAPPEQNTLVATAAEGAGQPPPETLGKNFAICAPQLLHLGRDKRPLWFNGWILDNKFDPHHPRLSKFDVFMTEKKKGFDTAEWKLEKDNLCCLESDVVYQFTTEEKTVLTDVINIAREVGALDKTHRRRQ